LVEYKKEALIMFKELLENYEKMVVESILHASINQRPATQIQAVAENRNTTGAKDEIGRNDLCPCGSGKKYKKCHGK
jgi:preprotein translocase subunit SecA